MPLFNPSTASGNITVQKAGATVGSRSTLNFIEGSNISETVFDNPGATSVDVTIAASVGAASQAGAYMVGTLSSFGEGSISGEMVLNIGSAYTGTGTWGAANRAYYIPVQVLTTITVYKMVWLNGATVGTNSIDVGIYTAAGTRLVSGGGVLTSGVSVPQVVDITDTVLTPDTYFLGMSMNGITDTVLRNASNALQHRASGVQQQSTAYPLPATMAAAGQTDGFVPAVLAVYESATF